MTVYDHSIEADRIALWNMQWGVLKDKDQKIIISIYGEDVHEEKNKDETKVRYPKDLLRYSKAHYRDDLGFNRECTRCGGCGEHSYNTMHGSKCFKCGGIGKTYKTPTDAQLKKVIKEYPDGFISELKRV